MLLPLWVRRRGGLQPQPSGTKSPISGEPNTRKRVSREVTNPCGPSARQLKVGLGWCDLNILPAPPFHFGGFGGGRFDPWLLKLGDIWGERTGLS